jgi:hypothetical protein
MTASSIGYTMAWRPAVTRLPSPYTGARHPATLGQEKGLEAFARSPVTALVMDVVAVGTTGFLAWGLGAVKNPWSTFWWVVSAGAAMKALHDLSRV